MMARKRCKKCGGFIGKKEHKCKEPWNKNQKMSAEYKKKCQRRQLGIRHFKPHPKMKGKWQDPEYKKRVSKAVSKGRKGIKFSDEHIENLSKSHKGKNCGEEHPNWKGGKVEDRGQGQLVEYKLWRLSVFERDGFTCQMPGCGNRGNKLNAHHIKKWCKYPELRFVVSNGITLCKNCHNKTLQKEEKFENLFMVVDKVFKAL